MATAIGEHDVLTAIEIPGRRKNTGSAYVKFQHPASRYAVIGVAALVTAEGGTCTSAVVALGGLVPRPMRAAEVEGAIAGQALSSDAIQKAASLVTRDLGSEVIGDLFASSDYRKATAHVWVKRALTNAAERSR